MVMDVNCAVMLRRSRRKGRDEKAWWRRVIGALGRKMSRPEVTIPRDIAVENSGDRVVRYPCAFREIGKRRNAGKLIRWRLAGSACYRRDQSVGDVLRYMSTWGGKLSVELILEKLWLGIMGLPRVSKGGNNFRSFGKFFYCLRKWP